MLQRIRRALWCVLLVTLIADGVYGVLLMRSVGNAVVLVPSEIAETRQMLIDEIEATRQGLNGQMDAARVDLADQVSRVLDGDPKAASVEDRAPLRGAVLEEARALRVSVVGDGTPTVPLPLAQQALQIIDSRLSGAQGEVAGLRGDLSPTLESTASLVRDAQDSWDDTYWDVKALIESATVAARGVAETSEAVGKAAPKLADSAVGVGNSADGIAGDVHRATTDFVKPKTTGQKFRAWLETAGKLAARFL